MTLPHHWLNLSQGVIVACQVPVPVGTKMDEIQILEDEVPIVLDH